MTLAESIASTDPSTFWTAAAVSLSVGLICFFWSFRALRHTRIIEDTPTSKIRSAAQGYTELEGTAELLDGEPIVAPLTGTHCVWYSIQVEEREVGSSGLSDFHFGFDGDWSDFLSWKRSGKGWSSLKKATSDAIFRLRDDTAFCIVDPEFADVNPSTSVTWTGSTSNPLYGPRPVSLFSRLFSNHPYRYTEKRIHSGDPVYVIGMFLTLGADQPDTSVATEIRDLLNCWKRDKKALLERFDLNRDGQIDIREWEVARKAARRTVEKSRKIEARQSSTNLIRKPNDSRLPFMLSAVPQHQLIKRQRRISGLFFFAFVCSVFLTAWAVHIRF